MQHQKHLFYRPENIHYLNCAAMGPLPKKVEEAGISGILQKSRPYQITSDRFFEKKIGRCGQKIVMPGEEFSSIVYAWDELKEKGVQTELVTAPNTLE
jgi:hypothetical protein